MSDTDALNRWLTHLEAFEESDVRPLADREEMLAVARELGLDDGALIKVEVDAEAALVRGQAFLTHGRPEDAVAELRKANALAPWRFDILAALAEARTAAFEKTGEPAHRAEAEAAARSLIQADPSHAAAYTLLNRLDRPVARPVYQVPPDDRGARRKLAWALGALALLVVLLLIGYLSVASAPDSMSAGPQPQPADPDVVRAADPDPVPRAPTPPAAPTPPDGTRVAPAGKHPLPLAVVPSPATAGLTFEDITSHISRHGEHVMATVRARVRNQSTDLISELKGEVVYLGAGGEVLDRDEVAVVNSATPQLRPGDQTFLTEHSSGLPWDTVKAELRFSTAQRGAGAGPWPATTPACLQFIGPPPADPGIAVRIRSQGVDGMFWRIDGEVENTRPHALTQVRFEARYLDAAGQPALSSMITDQKVVAEAWLPPFQPGEVRLFHTSRIVSREDRAKVDRACLAITALR